MPNLTYQFAKSTAPNSLNQTYQTKLMSVQMIVRRLDEYEAENEQGPVGDTRKDLSFLRQRYKLEFRESNKLATWSNLYFLGPGYIL